VPIVKVTIDCLDYTLPARLPLEKTGLVTYYDCLSEARIAFLRESAEGSPIFLSSRHGSVHLISIEEVDEREAFVLQLQGKIVRTLLVLD
jgi:hypothetical protein